MNDRMSTALMWIGLGGPWIWAVLLAFMEREIFWAALHFMVPPMGWAYGVYRIVTGVLGL